MFHDRPAMAEYGAKAEPLYRWAARKFAGEDLKQRIRWDSSEPLSAGENHGPSQTSGRPRIQIRNTYYEGKKKGQKIPCEELWSTAVYELYNITCSGDTNEADANVVRGRLTKEAFLARLDAIERRAGRQDTRLLCEHLPTVGERAPRSKRAVALARRNARGGS